jgi:hypothetical protein
MWALQEALVEQYLCFKHPGFSEEQEWRLIKLVNTRAELELVDLRQMQARLEHRNEILQEEGQGIGIPPLPDWWPLSNPEGIEIRFRHSSMGYVPYIQLDVRHRFGNYLNILPLDQVMHGPTPNAELSRESLTLLLKYRGFGPPMTYIRSSTIPLR